MTQGWRNYDAYVKGGIRENMAGTGITCYFFLFDFIVN